MKELTPLRARKLQKFHRLDLVKVDVVSPYMQHFQTDFYGIVAYSYMEKFGGTSHDEYSIIVLSKDLTKAINQIAWYNEPDLTLSDKLTKEQVEKILEDLKWIDL